MSWAGRCLELRKGERKIVALHFPYRKKVGLGIYLPDTNTIAKMATFNNEKSAELFMEYLAEFVEAERIEDETE